MRATSVQAPALEKLISVTSTVEVCQNPPPRPRLKDLPPVNCNPRNPLENGSPEARRVSRHAVCPIYSNLARHESRMGSKMEQPAR